MPKLNLNTKEEVSRIDPGKQFRVIGWWMGGETPWLAGEFNTLEEVEECIEKNTTEGGLIFNVYDNTGKIVYGTPPS
ncbi:hypothetical protein HY227_02355 [Candidatus Wolfebacteria bacterium]|nr:hypothetical protein [Candidatus Wolfebacteria bacterium]